MLRSILVPLDGSTFGEHALPLAAGIARRAGVPLHLVHVHEVVVPQTPGGMAVLNILDLHTRQDEQAYMADVVGRLRESGPIDVKIAMLDGLVADSIRDYVEREEIDLVVMATHGRNMLKRFWLGSIVDALANKVKCPLLLARAGEGKVDMQREIELRSITIPLDGTEFGEKVIEPSLELGRLFDAEFTLVHVNQPAILSVYLPEGAGAHTTSMAFEQAAEIERREESEAKRYLAGVAAKLATRDVRVRTHVVLDERPAEGILHEAEHADLIAIETHGRRGLARFFLGSVADEVVQAKEGAPVLLHHA